MNHKEMIFRRTTQCATLGGIFGFASVVAAPIAVPVMFALAVGSATASGASAGAIGSLIGSGVGVVTGTAETMYAKKRRRQAK